MITIGNVRYFGNYTNQVIAEEIAQIAAIDLGQQMHILRHFTCVSANYKKSIIGKPYQAYNPISKKMEPSIVTYKDILEKLNITGSKFIINPYFENPYELCEYICNYMLSNMRLRFQWFETTDVNQFCRFYINFENAIGTQGVGYKFDLSETQKATITIQKRGVGANGYNINTAIVNKLELTPQLAVTLIKNPNGHTFLATSYSGMLVPTMPDPSHQKNEELVYNQEYWNNIILPV